jgi:hypothetical protein
MNLNTPLFVDCARMVSNWSMRDVLDFMGQHSIDTLEYPADADSDLMRVTDDANRQAAVVYLAGYPQTSETMDVASRSLEFVRG